MQKTAVDQVIDSAQRPLSFEDILKEARKVSLGLSERTLYRQLQQRIDEAQLVRVFLPGQPARYEVISDQAHAHFICNQCDRVFILPGEVLAADVKYQVPDAFVVEGMDLVFYGRCAECK